MKRRLIWLCAIAVALIILPMCSAFGAGVYDGVDWKITGDFELVLGKAGETQTFWSVRTSGWPWADDAENIKSVRFEGTVYGNGSLYHMFGGFKNLMRFDTSGFDVSRVTDMSSMFKESKIPSTLDFSGWDVRRVQNMSEMFWGAEIAGTIDLTGWDVRRVTNARSMFHTFVGNVIMPDMQWQSIGATQYGSLYEMFYAHKGFLEVPNWSFGRATSLSGVFRVGDGDVNAANWNLDGVERADNMFRISSYTTQFYNIDISGWHSNTLTSATEFFAYSRGIKEIDVSNWDMPALTNIYEFIGASSDLERIIGWDTWDVSNITNMGMLCYNAQSLVDVGDISHWDTSNVTNIVNLFYYTKLRDIDLSGWDVSNVTNATNFYGIFQPSSPPAIRTADLSGWCDITPYVTGPLFGRNCPLLKFTVGNQWRMKSENGRFITLASVDNVEIDGVVYSDYWYHESRKYGPFRATSADSTNELAANYTPEMAGTWLREPKYYTIHFVPLFEDATGEMEDVQAEAHGSFTLPENQYHLYEHEFIYWQDENGNQYGDMNEIPAGTYLGGDTITLTAVLKASVSYTVQFVADDAAGSMPQLDVGVYYNYKIHQNLFSKFNYEFDHWDDGKGHTYANREVIPSGTYEKDEVVILRAVFVKNHHGVAMEDGAFTFSLKRDETAVFDPLPANIGYQVYEQTSEGWILVQTVNASGTIEALEEFEAKFLNKYDPAKIAVQFSGLKLMDGIPAEKDTFTFELWGEDGYVQSKTVQTGGFVQFDPIEFLLNDVGEYHYVIKERIGADDTIMYDGHEEHVTVKIYRDGSVAYAHTDNIDDSGNKVDVIDHSRDGELQTIYAHTDNIDDDGNKLSDYVNMQRYSQIVTIPGAAGLHVKVKYTNVRGPFYVWAGAHNEVLTESFSAACNTSVKSSSNPGGYERYFTYQSGRDQEYLYDEFDIKGDSLSIWYYSAAYPESGENYSDIVNYGYYMEVTADSYLKEEYAHSARTDGAALNDYESNKYYTQVITIPNAEKLHVKIKYTNPRGTFYIWKGAHPVEIETQQYTADCNTSPLSDTNPGGYYRFYTYQEGKNNQYLNAAFDVDGDSISISYYSYAYPMSYNEYSDMINYGYYMEITSGSIVAAVETDDDGVKFENISAPGKLVLQKFGSEVADSLSDNVFYYEVQFLTANGMPYELQESTIVYEQRDGLIQDFPDLNMPEKAIYDLTVNMIKLSKRNDFVTTTEKYQYHAGDIYSIYLLPDMLVSDVTGADVVQTQSGWQGMMPAENVNVNVYYSEPTSIAGSILWHDDNDVNEMRPDSVTVHLIRDGVVFGFASTTADANWKFVFEDVPLLDRNGNAIQYSVRMDEDWQNDDSRYLITYDGYIVDAILSWTSINTTGVTLLSVDEYTANKDNIPLLNNGNGWWLRSPGRSSNLATRVDQYGAITHFNVGADYVRVRPALICDLNGSGLSVGDHISFAYCSWTVISDSIILCDDFVGQTMFRADRNASDANVYAASDVKVWLENWATENGIAQQIVEVEVVH